MGRPEPPVGSQRSTPSGDTPNAGVDRPVEDLGGEAGPACPRSHPQRAFALDVYVTAVHPRGAARKPISDPRGRHGGKVEAARWVTCRKSWAAPSGRDHHPPEPTELRSPPRTWPTRHLRQPESSGFDRLGLVSEAKVPVSRASWERWSSGPQAEPHGPSSRLFLGPRSPPSLQSDWPQPPEPTARDSGPWGCPGGVGGSAAKPRGDLRSSWRPASREPLAGVCPGLEGTFGGGGQGWAVHLSAVRWGAARTPTRCPSAREGSGTRQSAAWLRTQGEPRAFPRTGPAPWAAWTGQPAPRNRDQLKAREAGGLRGDEPLGPPPHARLTLFWGPNTHPPHSVVGAQNPCPMPGTSMRGCLSWEPLSRAVRAGGQAPSHVLRRDFPGKPQPGGGLRGKDVRGQRRGSECRAQVGTAAGYGPGRQRASWPVVVTPRDSLARVLAGGGVRAVSPHQAPRCPRPPS